MVKFVLILISVLTLARIVSAEIEKDTVLSLQNIHCQSCGAKSVEALKKNGLISKAEFDRDKVEIKVRYNPEKTDMHTMIEAIGSIGRTAVAGPGKGSYMKHQEFAEELDVKVISKNGEDVKLKQHLVKGKVTVFDFYATWCGPCREVDKAMKEILKKDKKVALRKLNIVDWKTPIAKRYMKNVKGLPYVVVYSEKGKKVDVISGLDIQLLKETIEKGKL